MLQLTAVLFLLRSFAELSIEFIMHTYSRAALPSAAVTFDMLPRPQRKMERRKYKRSLYWFGFIEIILGIASIGVCVVGLIIAASHSRDSMLSASSGLWCGAVMMVSGILGVRVTRQSSPCLIKANMTASILSSIFMGIMFILSMFSVIVHHALMAIYVFLSIIASAGFVLNIVHAAFCCATVCCISSYVHCHEMQPTGQGPIVRYMLVDGQPYLMPPSYPGATTLGVQSGMSTLLHPPGQQEDDLDKIEEPSTPPPAYMSCENLNTGPSTSS